MRKYKDKNKVSQILILLSVPKESEKHLKNMNTAMDKQLEVRCFAY